MTTEHYNDIQGANTLAEFLIKDLSPETLFRIYQDRAGDMERSQDLRDNVIDELRCHVQTLFYNAGYNMIWQAKERGLIDEATAEKIIDL